jgi:signal transduction histidine kinase
MNQLPSMVRRLIVWQIGAMAVAWLVLSGWLIVQMMAYGNGDLDRRMDYFAQTLAEAASAARDDPSELQRRLRTAERIFVEGVIGELDSARHYVPVYQLWTSNGRLIHASAAAPAVPLTADQHGYSQARWDDHDFRVVAAMSSDGRVRAAVAERIDQRLSANWPMLQIIGGSQLLILSWIVAITWLAARRGFKPLTALAEQIARRQPGELSPLNRGHVYAETEPIVQEINALLLREGRRLETERGFLADAAHELRTPLAAINAQAHVLITTKDAAALLAAQRELQEGMERVSHLLSQLLTIARLEAGPTQGPVETLDIADLCRQRLATMSRLARGRAISLTLNAPDSFIAKLERSAFLSILDNLVDNAIRYTPSGGHVEVRLGDQDGGICLSVRDDGPGIAIADRERVFERFVRLPQSSELGSGLGLAIVQRLVASQAASLRFIEGLSGRGVGFLVQFH